MTAPQNLLGVLERAAEAACRGNDPAHDIAHVRRVARLARRIAEAEGADTEVAAAAALLHELWSYPKDHPESHRSGELCAERARVLLDDLGVDGARADAIAACIRDHAFSRGAQPATLEAAVLQDADRLDAIGAIGVARWAATCATMARPFYDETDPFCGEREPDDGRYGVDHFYAKLLRIADSLHTETAREIAAERAYFLDTFLVQLERDIG